MGNRGALRQHDDRPTEHSATLLSPRHTQNCRVPTNKREPEIFSCLLIVDHPAIKASTLAAAQDERYSHRQHSYNRRWRWRSNAQSGWASPPRACEHNFSKMRFGSKRPCARRETRPRLPPDQATQKPRMACLAATRKEGDENSATRRCTPRPDIQSGDHRAWIDAVFFFFGFGKIVFTGSSGHPTPMPCLPAPQMPLVPWRKATPVSWPARLPPLACNLPVGADPLVSA